MVVEILLVDDEPLVRSTVERALRRAGHRVHVAATASEALALLQRQPAIAVVVSDVMMDDVHGPDLVRRLRELRPDLAAVLMSGETRELIGADELPEGTPFVGKPFSSGELLRAVERALGQSAQARGR